MKGRITALLTAAWMGMSFASAAQAVELVLWEHEMEDIQKDLDARIADFQKSNPDLKVKRAHYKTEDLRTQFQTAAMGGGGADLVLAPNDFGGPFAIMGIIQPVQKWADLSRFDATTVAAVKDPQGDVWGVPVSRGNHLMLFVNTNLVKTPPKTIEELVKIAKEHSDPKKNKYGFAYNLTEPFWFVTFLGAYGQSPLVDGKPNLDGPGMEKALALVKGFKFTDKIVPPDCDYACAETLFVEKKVPMIINGDWAIEKYREVLGDKLAIQPLPELKATGKHMAPMTSGKFLFFNNKLKGKKLEAAKKFATFVTSPETQTSMVKETGRLPALKAVADSAVVSGDPILKATDEAMTHGQPMPMAVEMRVVWDAIRPQLQNVMAGRTEPIQAAGVMQKDAVTKIRQMTE